MRRNFSRDVELASRGCFQATFFHEVLLELNKVSSTLHVKTWAKTSTSPTMRCIVVFLLVHATAAFLPSFTIDTGRSRSRGQLRSYPDYVPPDISEIEEEEALQLARRMRRVPVTLPSSVATHPVETNYVRVEPVTGDVGGPILLLHGFDSSLLEWRRLIPELEKMGADTYAMDVLGWGFTGSEGVTSLGAEAKRTHLLEFWKQVMGERPMTLVGASLGGTIALDFAHEFPEAVKRLVLIDAQGFIDGAGPGGWLPEPLARIGVTILGSKPLRSLANEMSYANKELATEDAVRIGRLHVHREGWADANLKFMGSGGFNVSSKVPGIYTETLIMWGRQDKILDPKLYAQRFEDEMPFARLVWVEDCGHVPHLEQPSLTAREVFSFVQNGNPLQEACAMCGGSELQACYNCDGQGSYTTYGVVVVCKGCKGTGNILCRSCFKGNPWDLEGVRARAEEVRQKSLLGVRRRARK